ncbi:hypothetical protein N9O56_01530 [Rickettsiales bacterium]|nr:hypothetical protein [Rickettsiales bacterium]
MSKSRQDEKQNLTILEIAQQIEKELKRSSSNSLDQDLIFPMEIDDELDSNELDDSSLSAVEQDAKNRVIYQEDTELDDSSSPHAAQDTAEHTTPQNAVREYKQTTCDYDVLPWSIDNATLSPYQGNYNPRLFWGDDITPAPPRNNTPLHLPGYFFSPHQGSYTPPSTSYTEQDSRDISDQSNDQNTKEEKEAEKNLLSNMPETEDQKITKASKPKSGLTEALKKAGTLQKTRKIATPATTITPQRGLAESLLDKTSEAKKDSKCCNIL